MKKNKYSLSLSLKFLCRVVLLTIFGTSFLFFSVKGDPVESQREFPEFWSSAIPSDARYLLNIA